MKNCFKLTLIFVLFLFTNNIVSQSNDSLNRLSRKYQNEIGIDLQGLFLKTPGTALIWKKKNNSGRFIELTSAKNYRFQLGIAGTIPTKEYTNTLDTSANRFLAKASSTFSIQAMMGTEQVKFYGRFSFFYGVDFGPYYSYANSGYTITASGNSASVITAGPNYYYFPFQTITTKIGLSLVPFVGAKFRISEHVSASIESGFYVSYFISKTKIFNLPIFKNSQSTLYGQNENSGFEFSIKYLRFLTLNYHI